MRTWSTWNPCALLVGNGTVAVKTSMVVLQKINGITIWSRNSTSRYILKRNESRVPKYLYIHMHSNIFKSGKIWNESKCSSTEACISKCGIYVCWVMSLKKEENMDTYWMNKIWMNLEDSKLSEIRQSQKDKHCMIPLTEVCRVLRFIEAGHRRTVIGLGVGRMRKSCFMGIVLVSRNEKVVEISSTTVWIYLTLLNCSLRTVLCWMF